MFNHLFRFLMHCLTDPSNSQLLKMIILRWVLGVTISKNPLIQCINTRLINTSSAVPQIKVLDFVLFFSFSVSSAHLRQPQIIWGFDIHWWWSRLSFVLPGLLVHIPVNHHSESFYMVYCPSLHRFDRSALSCWCWYGCYPVSVLCICYYFSPISRQCQQIYDGWLEKETMRPVTHPSALLIVLFVHSHTCAWNIMKFWWNHSWPFCRIMHLITVRMIHHYELVPWLAIDAVPGFSI